MHLEVSDRSGNPVEYVASERVELLEGFVSNDNDVFEIRIASGAGGTTKVMCLDPRPLTDPGGYLPPVDKCQEIYDLAIEMAQDILQIRKAALLAQFEAAYRAKCLQAKDMEVFTVGYTNSEYHYTLYYYDQAGGLVKTVPPKGVRPDFSSSYTHSVKAARAAGNYLAPRPHELVTQYRYNSLGQVVAQRSPDAGDSRFWYDRLGRLAVSQNAQQADDNKYSYTRYDLLGRITEVGQKPQSTAMNQSTSQDETALNSWLNNGSAKEQLTRTVYDLPYGYATNVNGILCGTYLCQQNLRNRVSYTMVFDTDPGAAIGTQTAATYYTYDIHGNVDQLLQDYNGVAAMSTADRFKLMSYEYDLISGKVNKVSYQPGKTDAFYHRYSYDAENRLTEVWTSRDQLVWERDAAYRYYKHGPLARMELGQLKVQGADYAYTLQGWLKGMNSTELNAATDLGKDGLASGPNANAARDIMGFALHYYDEGTNLDYAPIAGTSAFARPNNAAFKSLYNGNIGGMSVNNGALAKGVAATTNALPLFYNYRYDQLNRLVSMQAYKGLASNTWTPVALDDYKEAISYDPNGNILTYNRNGSPEISGKATAMDELTYNYYATTNRLQQVSDAVTGTNYTEDIDQQSNPSNYTYDKIGNLKTDVAEGITAINWSVYGKISSIVKAAGTISYSYDVSGNRIAKTFLGKTTVYVRDASGNVMSVYEKPASGTLVQLETHLYGSSRIGLASQQSVVPESGITLASGYGTATLSTFTRNEKIFEVSNHLGNVLATVSDKKLQVDVNTDVVSASDYAPFGMGLVGRKFESAKYRYGFNGKENDDEVKGDGNQQDYGMRIYDPRLGRFLSVDPLTKSYPFLTPYAFAENDVISSIDLDGLEKYRIVGRSFAPRWAFTDSHFESRGDDRSKFEIADYRKVSARIHVQITINMNEGTKDPVFMKKIYSQPTILAGGSSWDVDRQEINIKSSQGATESFVNPVSKEVSLRGSYYAKNGTNVGPGIDIQFDIGLKGDAPYLSTDDGRLDVNAKITGNIFPAQETLIFDEKGNGIFVGTSTAIGGPLSGVWGTGEQNVLSSQSFTIATDKDGSFTGVYSKDKNGNETVISPAAWNKRFSNKQTWNQQDDYTEDGIKREKIAERRGLSRE